MKSLSIEKGIWLSEPDVNLRVIVATEAVPESLLTPNKSSILYHYFQKSEVIVYHIKNGIKNILTTKKEKNCKWYPPPEELADFFPENFKVQLAYTENILESLQFKPLNSTHSLTLCAYGFIEGSWHDGWCYTTRKHPYKILAPGAKSRSSLVLDNIDAHFTDITQTNDTELLRQSIVSAIRHRYLSLVGYSFPVKTFNKKEALSLCLIRQAFPCETLSIYSEKEKENIPGHWKQLIKSLNINIAQKKPTYKLQIEDIIPGSKKLDLINLINQKTQILNLKKL